MMYNDPDLMEFNTWTAERPELLESGAVTCWHESDTKTWGVLWWGPSTAGLEQVRAEADRRGITFVVRQAKYSPADLDNAVQAVMGAREDLMALGFDLSVLSGRRRDHQGLTLYGRAVGESDRAAVQHLHDDLVRRTKEHVAGLAGVAGVIAPADVRVQYRYYSPQ